MKNKIIVGLAIFLALSLNAFAEDDSYKMDEDGKLVKVDENFDNTVDVRVNGIKIKFKNAKPFINKENRTVVPVRFIAEALGAEVDWNGETRTVFIDQDEKNIKLEIGAMQATVNSEIIKFDTRAEIYFDRTFVPLRFVSETLGATVGWDGETRTVVIDTEKEEIEVPEDIQEKIDTLESEQLKEVAIVSPNNYIKNKEVFYGIDGKKDFDSIGIIVEGATESDPTALIAVYSNMYNKDYSVLKEMLKVYYPTEFESVYTYVSNVIDNEKSTTERLKYHVYDGRSFACRKLEKSVSIYIGGKTSE